jgi:hypothetical protein
VLDNLINMSGTIKAVGRSSGMEGYAPGEGGTVDVTRHAGSVWRDR